MTQVRDGARVAYVGDDMRTRLEIGDAGLVLACTGSASHVRWSTGAREGEIVLVPNMDLVAQGAHDVTPLFEGSLITTALRATYDERGATGVIQALGSEGHLGVLDTLVDDTLDFIAARLRNDISMQAVLDELGPDDGEAVLSVAARIVARDLVEGD